MILLDTHVLLWLDREDPALGHLCRERIQSAWTSGLVAVCANSLWEVAMQAARGRDVLRQTPESCRLEWLAAGLRDIPLDGALALSAAQLEEFQADPADRFIVAASLWRGATLITADRLILGWTGPLLRCSAAS
jgi:PIN domain nuclease of toxin-antitoxin system